MTAPLHMIQLRPDLGRMAQWAFGQDKRMIPRGGDTGYVLHALLTAAFGAGLAPKPFRLVERDAVLYGYTAAGETALRDYAATYAEPAVHAALGVEGLAVKAMPSQWPAGRRLGFEVRVRPVVRLSRSKPGVHERDAFLHACDAAGPAAPVSREAVYCRWVADAFARQGGAQPVERQGAGGAGGTGEPHIRLAGFRRTRVVRRNGERSLGKEIEGPDADIEGVLEVTEAAAFNRLLARGLGRHRAFGYGMLLIRPVAV